MWLVARDSLPRVGGPSDDSLFLGTWIWSGGCGGGGGGGGKRNMQRLIYAFGHLGREPSPIRGLGRSAWMNNDDFLFTLDKVTVLIFKGGMLSRPLEGRLKDVATWKLCF